MAGLRRYLAASSLRLLDITPVPLPDTFPGATATASGTRLTAISVGVRIDGQDQSLPLVLKEPPVSRGRVLRAVGQREYGVYRRLAPHLPLLVPGLVAGDEAEGWVVLEALTGLRPAHEWTADDYVEAVLNLAALHDRFWGLADDLANLPWLARPLDTDYADTVVAAAEALQTLVLEERLPQLNHARYYELFAQLTRSADEIAAPLRAETATLIHGDYWPGNIARPLDGRQIVFDWQLAGIGPAVLDLVGFVQSVRMRLEPALPVEDMVALYLERCHALIRPGWDDDHFQRLWDHALMWLFLAHWLGRLATVAPDSYDPVHARFSAVWLEPLAAVAQRRL